MRPTASRNAEFVISPLSPFRLSLNWAASAVASGWSRIRWATRIAARPRHGQRPLSALCNRWLTTRRMGEDTPLFGPCPVAVARVGAGWTQDSRFALRCHLERSRPGLQEPRFSLIQGRKMAIPPEAMAPAVGCSLSSHHPAPRRRLRYPAIRRHCNRRERAWRNSLPARKTPVHRRGHGSGASVDPACVLTSPTAPPIYPHY